MCSSIRDDPLARPPGCARIRPCARIPRSATHSFSSSLSFALLDIGFSCVPHTRRLSPRAEHRRSRSHAAPLSAARCSRALSLGRSINPRSPAYRSTSLSVSGSFPRASQSMRYVPPMNAASTRTLGFLYPTNIRSTN